MKTVSKVFVSGAVGVVMAASVATPALAWHPKGEIKKYVQNQTQQGQLEDANTNAVASKPGDILRYVIEVKNAAAPANNEYNDMYYTVMTDELPAGVELVSNPAQRKITENIGNVKPGQKVTKEYLVKVTATKDKEVVDNKACFTGDSKVKDNPQKGCDNAKIKVENPTPETPTTPETPETPEVLPNTGIGNILLPAGIAGAFGYLGNLLRLKRRARKA